MEKAAATPEVKPPLADTQEKEVKSTIVQQTAWSASDANESWAFG
jgi:hypothetical protein